MKTEAEVKAYKDAVMKAFEIVPSEDDSETKLKAMREALEWVLSPSNMQPSIVEKRKEAKE